MKYMSYRQIVSLMLYIQRGTFIVLCLPPTSFELFYICTVLDFGTAAEDMVDTYNHHISMGTKNIPYNYLEKQSEKKSRIIQNPSKNCSCLACSGYDTNGRIRWSAFLIISWLPMTFRWHLDFFKKDSY